MPKLSVSVRLAAAAVFLSACGASSAEQTASGDSATAAAGTQPANT